MLFGKIGGINFLKNAKKVLQELEIELLMRGHRYLRCMVETPIEIRFAEWFGFEQTYIKTELGSSVMIKDLHV